MATKNEEGKPVQIVAVNEDHTFTLNEEGLENILTDVKDLPVVVISIAGAMRQGKSFLLSFFIRYLRAKGASGWLGDEKLPLQGFSWRGGCEADTSGILMWSQPFQIKIPSGKTVGVLLMDTQGAFDNNSTFNDCATIFALSTLISSVQIFNIKDLIKENDLQNLQIFTEYGKLALEKSGQKPFQKLMFLVRDWASEINYVYGSEGGKKYIDKTLEVNAEQHAELSDVRRSIRACFEEISCFLMPHPGLEVAEANFEGRIVDIRKKFVEQLCVLVQELLAPEKLIVKTFVGQQIKAAQLLTFFREYMKVFQDGTIPKVQSILKATADASNMIAVTKAKELYQSRMESAFALSGFCIDDNALEAFHLDSESAALQCFQQKPKLNGQDMPENWLNTLEKLLVALYYEFVERNKETGVIEEAASKDACSESLQVYKDLVEEKLKEKIRYSTEDLLNLHKYSKAAAILKLENAICDSVGEPTKIKLTTNLSKDIEKHYLDVQEEIKFNRERRSHSIDGEYDTKIHESFPMCKSAYFVGSLDEINMLFHSNICEAWEYKLKELKDKDPEQWRVAKYQLSLAKGETPFTCGAENSKSASTALEVVESGVSGAAAAKLMPSRFQLLYGNLGANSSVFGIKDMAHVGKKNWVLRVDQAHKRVGYDHLNINSKMTKVANPAAKLPAGAATAGNIATNTLKVAGNAAVVVGAVADTYSVGKTIYNDMQDNHTLTSQTGKKTATVAAGWAGGLGGAVAGEAGGAAIGGAIGALFGGVGAIPGAAIGGMLGGLAGGIGGGITAPIVAGKVADAVRGKLTGRLLSHKCGTLELKPAFPPEDSDERIDQWYKIVLDFVQMVLEHREMFVLTWHDAEDIFISEPLDYTIEKLNEMSYFKASLTKKFLTDACTSPQFSFSEMAFTSPNPNIADARKLRGSTIKKVLGGKLKIDNEYIFMTNDGRSLFWQNPAMPEEIVKSLLKKNESDILVSG